MSILEENNPSAPTRTFIMGLQGEGDIERVAVYLHCPGHGALSLDKKTGLYRCPTCRTQVRFQEVKD